jgi:hypothetical protein
MCRSVLARFQLVREPTMAVDSWAIESPECIAVPVKAFHHHFGIREFVIDGNPVHNHHPNL